MLKRKQKQKQNLQMGLLKERQAYSIPGPVAHRNDRLSHQAGRTPRATAAQKELGNC